MAKQKNLAHRKQIRQLAAIERQEQWRELSAREQLEELINRGHSHCKQAQRLVEQISNEANKQE